MTHTVDELLTMAEKRNLILDGVPENVYHAIPAMSASGLREFRKGPGYFKWWRENPKADTASRLEGRLAHMAIGEPDRFSDTVVIIDGHRGGTAVKEAVAAAIAAGKVPVKSEQARAALGSADFCRRHPLIAQILMSGKAEQTMLWKEETDHGAVLCKARVDWVTANGVLIDWKTFSHVWDDGMLEYQARTMGYEYQAAWYLRGYSVITKGPSRAFYSVFVRNEEPWDAAVREISVKSLNEVVPQIKEWLDHYAACLAEDSWPMTAPTVGEITLKSFT